MSSTVNYFKDRWLHVKSCYNSARNHRAVVSLVGLIAIYAAYTTYVPAIQVPEWAKPDRWPKIPFCWFMVIAVMAALLIIIEGSFRMCGPQRQNELRTRTLTFGKDLYALLRDAGPKPDLSKKYGSLSEQVDAVMAANSPRVEKIHYGYLNRLRDRGVQLLRDLDETHIRHGIEHWEIDPPQAVRGDTVKRIAERCLLIVAQMDIDEESKGT